MYSGENNMKTAFVAGSSQGIGKAIGIDLLKQDYIVYFNGRTAKSLDKIEDILEDYPNAHFINIDLSNIENCLSLAKVIKNVDILVWNVGTTDRTPFGEIKKEEWKKVFEANVDAPFFFIQAMKDKINKNGKIILISSVLGIVPNSRSISYGVTKATINMLVPYLAKEFADKNIRVNAVAPGFIDSDWHKNKTTKQIEQIKSECLAKRLGTPEEIAKAVISIVDNDFINGQVIRIDGGYGL
jgi:3-oxoacyl-[acyl-carrier protein] reductase